MTFNPDDPPIDCTEEELAFCAWQTAQGRGDQLGRAGNAWEAFTGWWNGRDMTYFRDLRQLARAAWNASSDEFESQLTIESDRTAFLTWWQKIVDEGRVFAGAQK